MAVYAGFLRCSLAVAILWRSNAESGDSCKGLDIESWTLPDGEEAFVGYHVLCIGAAACGKGSSEDDASCDANAEVPMAAFWNGLRISETHFSAKMPATLLDAEELLMEMQPLSNPQRRERIRKVMEKKSGFKGLFGFYNAGMPGQVPERLKTAGELAGGGLFLAYEGGPFLWPGVQVGFQRNISFTPRNAQAGEEALHLSIKTMSMQPLVVEVSNFLNEKQRKHVIEVASPVMQRSMIVTKSRDGGKADDAERSSTQAFVEPSTPSLKLIDRLVSGLSNIPVQHGEHLQVLKYEKDQRYVAHHDYFDTQKFASNEMIQTLTKKGLFNRLATVFFYLSDVEEGGETNFPRAGGLPPPANKAACDTGVSVKPLAGRIIIFYSMMPDGNMDALSYHSGCAVKRGTKWSANKWLWNKPMEYIKE
eukprot:TRINITY_DN23577_c0_g1_i2.p1 TRINITY_DN23577_c0_g1~~TRINITY_DN23577_c0_g1_i2.p1  ORF type:complete len:421 (-),score=78.13 TRINITY_DN23577_c0_g1_i2:224-1486(-)